jgi:hypothetical protein
VLIQSSALYVALTKRDPPVSLDVSYLSTNPQQRVYLPPVFSFLTERKRKKEKGRKGKRVKVKNKNEKKRQKQYAQGPGFKACYWRDARE